MTLRATVRHCFRRTSGAAGHVDIFGVHPKVSVAFPRETFNAINARVKQNGTSFAHEVRELVAVGLLADGEDVGEPKP